VLQRMFVHRAAKEWGEQLVGGAGEPACAAGGQEHSYDLHEGDCRSSFR
jgi:hypothetical protein